MNTIIITQILILGILVIIGVVAAHLKILTKEVNQSVSQVVFYITLPLLLFSSISSIQMKTEIITNSVMVFVFTFAALFMLYWLARLSAFLFELKDETRTIHIVHTLFGNTIFLGFPLIKAVYGEEGLLYAMVYQLASDIVMWTIGVSMMQNQKQGRSGMLENLKALINPCTIAFLIGFVVMILGIHIPYVISNPLSNMGQTTIPLSMLYIGGMLAFIDIKGMLSHSYVFAMSINKMLISPIIIFLIMYFLNRIIQFQISFIALSVIILQVAMPGMATIVILSKRYGLDDRHATENVFVSTVLSIISLPLIYFVINFINKII